MKWSCLCSIIRGEIQITFGVISFLWWGSLCSLVSQKYTENVYMDTICHDKDILLNIKLICNDKKTSESESTLGLLVIICFYGEIVILRPCCKALDATRQWETKSAVPTMETTFDETRFVKTGTWKSHFKTHLHLVIDLHSRYSSV